MKAANMAPAKAADDGDQSHNTHDHADEQGIGEAEDHHAGKTEGAEDKASVSCPATKPWKMWLAVEPTSAHPVRPGPFEIGVAELAHLADELLLVEQHVYGQHKRHHKADDPVGDGFGELQNLGEESGEPIAQLAGKGIPIQLQILQEGALRG